MREKKMKKKMYSYYTKKFGKMYFNSNNTLFIFDSLLSRRFYLEAENLLIKF